MSKYIENINTYMLQQKIKQSYLSLITGIDKNKLSRILTGNQDINSTDMEKIAAALGQKVQYFLSEDFFIPQISDYSTAEVTFYAGEPNDKQIEFAKQLISLIENADEILSAKNLCMIPIGE